jgi:hypothetical protein
MAGDAAVYRPEGRVAVFLDRENSQDLIKGAMSVEHGTLDSVTRASCSGEFA